MIENPFPGPQPYRAADRERFRGREDASHRLEGAILGSRCVTVYGPSGAGKSSLMQAAVIPKLIDEQDIRVVRVDAWPESEDPTAWLATSLHSDLRFGDVPADIAPAEVILSAAKRAARSSSRLMLVYLDQIEQLLYPDRDAEKSEQFFTAISDLVDLPLRSVRVVLSLREDYLGRFRDRLRDRRRLLDHGFRVGPLTVAELTSAMCLSAASGVPPQAWDEAAMRGLMLQVRVPGQAASDEAEAQSAYAQIVCRALFEERAEGSGKEEGAFEAEPILRRYLETTLSELGDLRAAAQRLLEGHLVSADGTRTLRTENELLRILPATELQPILRALERAAILHAEEHQGSRYFEIGHDWLARKVFEERARREQEEEQRRKEEEQRIALAKARRERRTFLLISALSLTVAAVTGGLGFWAFQQKRAAEAARREAEAQERIAKTKESEAHDASILVGFRELRAAGKLAMAMKLLPEVERPAERRGWIGLATDALDENALRLTLAGHTGSLVTVAWSPDGKKVLTASTDRTARVWNADGHGEPLILSGHREALTFALFSPDGQHIVTGSEDGTARVSSSTSAGDAVVLEGAKAKLNFAAFSPDGARIVTASDDGVARIYSSDGKAALISLETKRGRVHAAIFGAGGKRVFTGTDDGAVLSWAADGSGKPTVLQGHKDAVKFLAASPDGAFVASASLDGTTRVFSADGKGAPLVLAGHQGAVYHVAWSPDGKLLATASADRTARIFQADGKGEPVVFQGHTQAITYVSFSPDGKLVATASADRSARVWPASGGAALVLQEHEAPICAAVFSPDGKSLATAAADRTERSPDRTAKLWNPRPARSMFHREGEKGRFFHAASFSVDREWFVAAFDDRKARRIRLDGTELDVFGGHEGWVTSAAPSPQGDRVVTTSADGTARVYVIGKEGEPLVLRGEGALFRFAAWSPDGAFLLVGSDDHKARIFSADGKNAPVVLEGHEDVITQGAWSPDGKRVVTTSLDETARVFSADGKAAPIVLSGHTGAVLAAEFTPDGQRVVTGSSDGTMRVWNLDGSSLRFEHGGAVVRVAVSPDGSRFASASTDNTVRVFWPAGGQTITLDTPAPALALGFAEGGQKVVAVAADDTARAWVIDVEALKTRLFAAHSDCVPAPVRAEYLRERAEDARERFESCEKAPTLSPAYSKSEAAEPIAPRPALGALEKSQSRPPKKLGPELRRVSVIVLPGDAEVEVDGARALRREGLIELVGKVGEAHKLRAQKGAEYIEADVTIADGRASLEVVDLNAKIAAKAAAAKSNVKTVGAGDFDPLMPEDMQ